MVESICRVSVVTMAKSSTVVYVVDNILIHIKFFCIVQVDGSGHLEKTTIL